MSLDGLFKLTLFAAAVLALLAVNLWFVRLTVQAFSSRELPDTIAPVQVLGSQDSDGKTGQALAAILLARMGRIRQEMAASKGQLEESPVSASDARPQVFNDAVGLALPTELLNPLDVTMKIGGVEVGGAINWIHRALSKDNVLQLAVEHASGRAIVSGVWNEGKDTVWVEVLGENGQPAPNDKVASAIAYALTQKQSEKSIPEVGAFSAQEFQTLLGALHDAATLHRQVLLGRFAESDFIKVLDRIEPLIARTPRWRRLIELAAGLAENGGKPEKAINLYRAALTLADRDRVRAADLEQRIAKLTERLAVVQQAQRAPVSPANKNARWPLNVLAVASVEMTRSPSIAVVGGVPAGPLDETRMKLIGGPPPQQPDRMLGEYVRTIIEAVELVAPRASFIFAPSQGRGGAFTADQLQVELTALINARPDILLITVGPLDANLFRTLLRKAASQGTLIVTAAGNEAGKPLVYQGDDLPMMTVASVGSEGKRSPFTQHGPGVVWAPGEKIPVRPQGDRIELRDGTSYAAALAAGVAARVLAEHPSITPEQLLALLGETSRPAMSGEPAIINLAAALKRLN